MKKQGLAGYRFRHTLAESASLWKRYSAFIATSFGFSLNSSLPPLWWVTSQSSWVVTRDGRLRASFFGSPFRKSSSIKLSLSKSGWQTRQDILSVGWLFRSRLGRFASQWSKSEREPPHRLPTHLGQLVIGLARSCDFRCCSFFC